MSRGVKGTAMTADARRQQKKEYQVKWRLRNPHYYRDWARKHYGPHRSRYLHYARKGHLKAKFGLTITQYDALLAAQSGVCAICGKPPQKIRLAVDHDHKTGLVRGLLCTACNRRLGVVEQFGVKAQEYLNRGQAVVNGKIYKG